MSALHFLYLRFSNDVMWCVRNIVKDPHEAEDITQSIFAKLLTAIQRYEPSGAPFKIWILRVARNAALDHLRSRRTTQLDDVYVADDSEQISHELCGSLRSALNGLPEEQRHVLVLRHIVGLTPVEIAGMLGKSESSVHGLHHRGRLSLRANLEELGASPTVAL